MNQKYDCIVIGGGHNGLVNAAYLARAGKRVLVLERRHVLGGAKIRRQGQVLLLPEEGRERDVVRVEWLVVTPGGLPEGGRIIRFHSCAPGVQSLSAARLAPECV